MFGSVEENVYLCTIKLKTEVKLKTKERNLIMKASNEKVAEIKKFAKENDYNSFTIPDNCPGDGWDGSLEENGAYCYGNNHFEGEFFKYEDMDEDLIDIILDEAEFEC